MTLPKSIKIILVVLVIALAVGTWGLKRGLEHAERTKTQGSLSQTSAREDGISPSNALASDTLDLAQLQAQNLPILIDFAGEG